MEPIIIDLDTHGWLSQRLRFASFADVLIGIIVVAQFLLTDNTLRVITLIGGALLILRPYLIPRFFTPRVVVFDDEGITRSLGMRHKLTTTWKEIASVEISHSLIHLHLKDEQEVIINLGNLTVEQYETVEPAIVEFIYSRNIDVRLG
jgi:hypothetical protein